ncbi:MAG: class I adenylate-forming enzyme family protein [Solirubrobacteraceae bacterium]
MAASHGGGTITGDLPRSIGSVPRRYAAERPTAPAVICREIVTTWAELDERSSRCAAGLLAAGLTDESRVAFLGRGGSHFFELLYGAAKAGVVLTSINWRLATPEVAFVLEDSGAELIFAESEYLGLVNTATAPIIEVPETGIGTWRDAHDARDPLRDQTDDGDVLQLYTSGTTGTPKGALISHRYLLGNIELMHASGAAWCTWSPHEAALITYPLSHIGGINFSFMVGSQGSPVVVLPDFDPAAVIDAVSRYNIVALPVVAPMLEAILTHPAATRDRLRSVRTVIYGAAPMPPELVRRAQDLLGCDFVHVYGMTECTIITTLPPKDHFPIGTSRALSVGRPVAHVELQIRDPEGRPLGPGEVGEVVVRSPVIMSGYWRRPEATAASFSADGWFRTGDAGELDDAGYLFLRDRIDDTFISGGENIYPAEIERVLTQHPTVHEAAVVGVPDERWGSVPAACLVVSEPEAFDPEVLRRHAEDHLARFKVPRRFVLVDDLPRNAGGKVLRRIIREQLVANANMDSHSVTRVRKADV